MVSAEFKLDGKNAIVAGQGGPWVRSAAVALADAGANVAVVMENAEQAKEVSGEVRALKRKTVAIHADLTNPNDVRKAVDQAIAQLGKIDILVNASDAMHAKPLQDISPDEWQRVIDRNLTPAFLFCQAISKHMLEHKKGRIINIASCLAERGIAHGAAYCTAMGGLLQLTRALSQEWARDGITVNAVGTGWFSETDKLGIEGEERLQHYLPLKRYGHPKEIGSLLVYLASDATDFVSGQFMVIDGAVMAHA